MKRQTALEIICALLIVLFVYTATSKLIDIKSFSHEMNNQPLPKSILPLLTWSLPFIEMVISISLLFERTRRTGLYASLVLMFLFTVYTGLVLSHVFERVPCSCGGVIRHLTWTQHLFFNLIFLSLSIIGLILHKNIFMAMNQGQPKTC